MVYGKNIVHTAVKCSALVVMYHVRKDLDKTNLIYNSLPQILFYFNPNLVIEYVNE